MIYTQQVLKFLSSIIPTETAYAHCDYPCGIYDPHRALIGALTVIRMIDILHDTAQHITEAAQQKTDDFEFRNNFIRGVAVKEEHAELVKQEVQIIWGDYFKAEHREKLPELDGLVHEIMQLGSKTKQTMDRQQAMQLLEKVNRFAEIFWKTKGFETKRVKAPYKPEEEIVYPILG